ncbi:MAG: hypothetical protein HQL10_01725 [Nitrospirae bacterium]|nr:hypothetical protein [Nitrospirota bacterium]
MKSDIKKQFDEAKEDYNQVGGWTAFISGQWMWHLIHKAFANYWESADVEYFETKYQTKDKSKLSQKLIAAAAKNSTMLGGVTGAVISVDEISAIVTGGGGGVMLPAKISIAAAALGAEAILMIRFQLELVANLAKLYGVPIDTNDPEDILVIFAFAFGGTAADTAVKSGMKVGGKLAGGHAKAAYNNQVLAALKSIAAKIGVKILQRNTLKYAIPIASIGIGSGWNYAATKAVGKIAIKHFEQRLD